MAALPTVLGFRVKSGWAVAVLVGGGVASAAVLDRAEVELSDPDVPGTRQPHHADFGIAQTNPATVRMLTKTIERSATRSIASLVERHRRLGHRAREAAVVVGSLRAPSSIANPHIRAHALEGQLFRRVLEDALHEHGVSAAAFVERDLLAAATERLRRSEEDISRIITAIGRGVKPWRSEEKAAALASWLLLAARPL